MKIEKYHSKKLEGKLKNYKGRLDATKEAISEMVAKKEILQEEYDGVTQIFQQIIKELKKKQLTKVSLLVPQIPIDLADPRTDIINLRTKTRKLQDRLNRFVKIRFQIIDYKTPICIYTMVLKERLVIYKFKTMF